MLVSRGVRYTTRKKNTAKIPRSIYNFSDSDSEMSYKDRGSPILLESGLKSFLGHPGHNYPLINGKMNFLNIFIRKSFLRNAAYLIRG